MPERIVIGKTRAHDNLIPQYGFCPDDSDPRFTLYCHLDFGTDGVSPSIFVRTNRITNPHNKHHHSDGVYIRFGSKGYSMDLSRLNIEQLEALGQFFQIAVDGAKQARHAEDKRGDTVEEERPWYPKPILSTNDYMYLRVQSNVAKQQRSEQRAEVSWWEGIAEKMQDVRRMTYSAWLRMRGEEKMDEKLAEGQAEQE